MVVRGVSRLDLSASGRGNCLAVSTTVMMLKNSIGLLSGIS
jgi:hypothetical protein